jgi:hypothetical protein
VRGERQLVGVVSWLLLRHPWSVPNVDAYGRLQTDGALVLITRAMFLVME